MSGALAATAGAAAADPLRASAAPTFASGTTGPAGPFTATAAGGVAPYSYAWEYVSGSIMTIQTPHAASTFIGNSGDASGDFRCKVTDASGVSVYTNNVTAETTTVGSGG